jgi:hypothetical protein
MMMKTTMLARRRSRSKREMCRRVHSREQQQQWEGSRGSRSAGLQAKQQQLLLLVARGLQEWTLDQQQSSHARDLSRLLAGRQVARARVLLLLLT